MTIRYVSLALTIYLASGVLCGCGRNDGQPGTTIERPGKVPVIYVEDDDPKMRTAMEKARNTSDKFVAAMNNPKPQQSGFAVKVPIKDGAQVEHMWISPVRFAKDQFLGTINDAPLKVKTVKLGAEVSL